MRNIHILSNFWLSFFLNEKHDKPEVRQNVRVSHDFNFKFLHKKLDHFKQSTNKIYDFRWSQIESLQKEFNINDEIVDKLNK